MRSDFETYWYGLPPPLKCLLAEVSASRIGGGFHCNSLCEHETEFHISQIGKKFETRSLTGKPPLIHTLLTSAKGGLKQEFHPILWLLNSVGKFLSPISRFRFLWPQSCCLKWHQHFSSCLLRVLDAGLGCSRIFTILVFVKSATLGTLISALRSSVELLIHLIFQK